MRIVIIVVFACTAAWADPVAENRPGAAWRQDFSVSSAVAGSTLPKGWVVQGKPGTIPAEFALVSEPVGSLSFLRMEADNGSASLITNAPKVDIKKTPILRWRWRATTLPDGADGRVRARDDQAIGIYVGTGSAFSNKSISYRWDTETPKGAEGNASYGLGAVKVKWFTLRNKEDAQDGEWYIEERNVAEDFKAAWGYYPSEVYISVSCNSQYTDSKAVADLEWIELISLSGE